MKIAIDIRALTDEHVTGVGVYTRQLVEALAELAPHDQFLLFASGSARVMSRLPNFKAANVQVIRVNIPNRLLFFLMKLPFGPMLENFLPTQPDVWIFPKFNIFRTKLPYFLTVHDLAFEIFPQFVTAKEKLHNRLADLQQVAKRAYGLLAVSSSTATDLEERWGISATKITVTPLGVNLELFTPREQPSDRTFRATYDLNRPYILALATQEPRKNLESVIEGYDIFRARGGRQLPLVLSGVEGWKTKLLQDRIQKSRFKDDILVLGYVPEKHKPALFRGSVCFVFPSFYEGFGLPALEAMACGIPVISSANSSLPEVIGSSGVLIDPFNVNDVASALHELIDEPEGTTLRQNLTQRAVVQANNFNWKKTAEATLAALAKLAH